MIQQYVVTKTLWQVAGTVLGDNNGPLILISGPLCTVFHSSKNCNELSQSHGHNDSTINIIFHVLITVIITSARGDCDHLLVTWFIVISQKVEIKF